MLWILGFFLVFFFHCENWYHQVRLSWQDILVTVRGDTSVLQKQLAIFCFVRVLQFSVKSNLNWLICGVYQTYSVVNFIFVSLLSCRIALQKVFLGLQCLTLGEWMNFLHLCFYILDMWTNDQTSICSSLVFYLICAHVSRESSYVFYSLLCGYWETLV